MQRRLQSRSSRNTSCCTYLHHLQIMGLGYCRHWRAAPHEAILPEASASRPGQQSRPI